MYFKKKLVVFLILFFLKSISGIAQGFITIKEATTLKPVDNCILTAYFGEDIIFYSITTEKGVCSWDVNNNEKVDSIVISALGYKSLLISKPNLNFLNLSVLLIQKNEQELTPVTVKSKRQKLVKINGDTTSYKVKDLLLPQDRNIEAVIARIPGITIEKSGQIKYNDKPIAGLTIDDDNILGNKYAIGTKNIKPEDIDSIQVLNNLQKILVLAKSNPSQAVYINLKSNKNNILKPIGSNALGIGYPKNAEANYFKLNLAKKIKTVTNILANNTKPSLIEALKPQELGYNSLDFDKKNLFGIYESGTTQEANLDNDFWKLNESIGVTKNLLNRKNKHKTNQLNVNVLRHYTNNESQLVNYFTLFDTIFTYQENNKSNNNHHNLEINFNNELNKNNLFFNYKIEANVTSNKSIGTLETQYNSILQNNNLTTFNTAISYNIIKPIKENLIFKHGSNLQHNNLKEINCYNFSSPFDIKNFIDSPTKAMEQFYDVKNYSLESSTQLIYESFVNINTTYKFQTLHLNGYTNQIEALTNGNKIYNPTLKNDNKLNAISHRLITNINKKFENFDFDCSFELINNTKEILVKNQNKLKFENFNFLYQSYFNYKVGKENNIKLNIAKRQFTEDDYLPLLNPVLVNYRQIRINNWNFPITINNSISCDFNYVKSLKLFFGRVSIKKENKSFNFISNDLLNSTVNQSVLQNFPAFSNSYSASIFCSKFWFALKTRFSGSISLNNNKSINIQNNQVTNWVNNSIFSQINASKTFNELLTVEISYNSSNSKSTIENSTNTFANNLSITKLSLSGKYSQLSYNFNIQNNRIEMNNQKPSSFLNINGDIRLTPIESKFSFYISCLNITNQTFFSQIIAQPQSQQVSNYLLRPFQLVFGFEKQF